MADPKRVFRRLVRMVMPESFRADYESELAATFAAQHREARAGGGAELARLWWETIAGLARTAPREHLAQARQDMGFALRMMRHAPAFTLAVVATLALAIGASSAIFSLIDAVLLRPLPYPEPERLAFAWNHLDGGSDHRTGLSMVELMDMQERMRTVEVAAFSAGPMTLTGRGEPERLRASFVTPALLDVLRVSPALGRGFAAEHERRGAGDAVLLADELWQRLFARSPSAIGRTLALDGRSYAILGVLPPGFAMPGELGALERSALLIPLTLDRAASRAERGHHFLTTVTRRRDGVTPASAEAELDALTRAFDREYPGEYDPGYRATLVPLRTQAVGDVQRPLLVLFGAVCLVLLIACANVANLLLARAQVRGREVAVRQALGATRARLVRQVLTESVVLAMVAAALGVALAHWLRAVLVAAAPELPRLHEARLDLRVLAVTVAMSLLTALLFGTLPALRLARHATAGHLRAARGGRPGIRADLRGALVVVQVSLALVLLVGAGLLLRSHARLMRVPSGFEPRGVLTFQLALPSARYEEREESVRLFARLADDLREVPGVEAAGAVAGLPLQEERGDWDYFLEGETPSSQGSEREADWQVVTPGYFEAMRTRLLAGRLFAPADTNDAPAVVLVNETLERSIFGRHRAVGKSIRMSGEAQRWMTIVGVVSDVRQDALDVAPSPEVYLPHAQFQPFWGDTTLRGFTVAVRSTIDPGALTTIVKRRVRTLDPMLPVSRVMTMEEVVSRSVAERRLQLLLLALFGGLALVLAVVGTYAVLSYHVHERRQELGVRLALGARGRTLLGMLMTQGMAPVAAGVALGLGGAALLTRLLARLLFDVPPLDPPTFVAAAAFLLLSALLACAVPLLRALRIAPAVALRED